MMEQQDDALRIQLEMDQEMDRYSSPRRSPRKLSTNIIRDTNTLQLTVPKIAFEDVILGTVLGTGGFNTVYRVTCSELLGENSFEVLGGDSPEMGEYALKRLDEDIEDPAALVTAAADLLFEAKILSEIPRHENVIRLLAVSSGFWISLEG
jgi:serine/threonine protein kinase